MTFPRTLESAHIHVYFHHLYVSDKPCLHTEIYLWDAEQCSTMSTIAHIELCLLYYTRSYKFSHCVSVRWKLFTVGPHLNSMNGFISYLVVSQHLSQCFSQMPGHHVPNCPLQWKPGNEKHCLAMIQPGKLHWQSSHLLSYWHEGNEMKVLILAGKLEESQPKMTNADCILAYVSNQTTSW